MTVVAGAAMMAALRTGAARVVVAEWMQSARAQAAERTRCAQVVVGDATACARRSAQVTAEARTAQADVTFRLRPAVVRSTNRGPPRMRADAWDPGVQPYASIIARGRAAWEAALLNARRRCVEPRAWFLPLRVR